MDEKIFNNLNSYLDLFNKCKYDQSLFNKNIFNSYSLLNLIFSLNHLYEWTLKDDVLDNKNKFKCIKNFNPYKNQDDIKDKDIKKVYNMYLKIESFPSLNINQYLIRLICNKTKHFKTSPKTNTIKSGGAAFGSMVFGAASLGSCPNIKYYVEHDGNTLDIIKLYDDLMSEWENFITL